MAVKIDFKTNARHTLSELNAVDKKLKDIQKQNSLKQGLASLNNRVQDSPLGGTAIGDAVGQFTTKLSGLTKLINPWTLAISSACAATVAFQKMAKEAVEKGMNASKQAEKINAQLSGQLVANGVYDSEPITNHLMKLSENGVSPVEKLTSAFTKLVPILKGDTAAALEWVEAMADAEAATGLSAEQLTTAVTQITTQGKIEEEVAKKLPFWQKLAEARGEDIATVQKLVQAHKIGSGEMLAAMKKAVAGYKGTAAAISATTEGAKASMEAARELAYKPAADAYNDKWRAYYTDKQAALDNKAADPEWQKDLQLIGNAEAEIELLGQAISDLGTSIKNGALGALAGLIDYFKAWTTEGELAESKIWQNDAKLGQLNKAMGGYDAATAKNTYNSLYSSMEAEQKKLHEYIENWELSSGAARDQWNATIKAQKTYIDALEKTTERMGRLSVELEQQEAVAAARAEAERQVIENLNNNRKLQEENAYKGSDQNAIAGVHLFNGADALISYYDQLNDKIKNHINLTAEEIEDFKELEKPYQAIMKLRQQEADNYKKSLNEQNSLDNSLVATAEDLRAEDEKRMMNGADLRREYGESAAYNTAFDKLSALAEKLNNSDLNEEEKSGILSKELANILQDAQQQAIRATEETLDAKGLKSLKDFNYTDFEVNDKMLKVQEDIKRASEDANTILDTISQKLPSPTIAL